jgi:biopolymer transport protein ExbB
MEDNFAMIILTGGGVVGYIIWAISIATLALIIEHFISIRRVNILPDLTRVEIENLFEARQYREAIELTEGSPDVLSYMIHSALIEAPHGYGAMERAMEEAAEERTAKMLRKIEWLNLIGNIGPMLGLFGTVLGMIGAFYSIAGSQSGAVKPTELAEDIGVALVTTLLGLAVAIPALAVYAFMRNRIDALTSEAMIVGDELINAFRPGNKKAQAAAPKPAEG